MAMDRSFDATMAASDELAMIKRTGDKQAEVEVAEMLAEAPRGTQRKGLKMVFKCFKGGFKTLLSIALTCFHNFNMFGTSRCSWRGGTPEAPRAP